MDNVLDSETLFKAINTSASVHQLLLASVERMAFGADFHLQVLFYRTSCERLTTYAVNGGLPVLGMDFIFHDFTSFAHALLDLSRPQK